MMIMMMMMIYLFIYLLFGFGFWLALFARRLGQFFVVVLDGGGQKFCSKEFVSLSRHRNSRG